MSQIEKRKSFKCSCRLWKHMDSSNANGYLSCIFWLILTQLVPCYDLNNAYFCLIVQGICGSVEERIKCHNRIWFAE